MLIVFYGNDKVRLLSSVRDFILKADFDEQISFDDSNVQIEEILAISEQNALFGGRKIVKLDSTLEDERFKEIFFKNLENFKKSENLFVLLENSLLAGDLKKLRGISESIQEFKLQEKRGEKFNIFLLADALSSRDKKTLWVLYEKALLAGKSPEEISGTIFWQLKTLLLVQMGNTKSLNPYVASKAKSSIKNFKNGELENLILNLIKKYHEARRGRGDMEIALERFILSV